MPASSSPAERLRALLAAPGLKVAPCCFDSLSAKLIASAGFPVTFMSGFAVSAARLGMPDTGLISFAEMLDSLRACTASAGAVPLIGDGDTGYGNALNVQRTVREYARAGAAAVMIEDQLSPKKCGHTKGKQVVDREEARIRVRAAVEAGRDSGILVLARTDARGPHGFDEAMARMRIFAEEGADILFLEAPLDREEMRRFCAGFPGKPCMANLVHGGATPILPPAEIEALGFKLAIYPLHLLAAVISAMQQALAALQPGAATALPPLASFDEIKRVVGFPEYWAAEMRFADPARRTAAE
ncbi:MAG: isocitrate lyase/PEP mutase family protein [Alphaproteobacteria bacterium]|nr:isocitrate lyase/PEP mutase family protein [Alphaproteobacteria bacterium]